MKKQKFVCGVANACHIIFSIVRVFSAIGAVCILLGILALSMLPGDFFSLNTTTQVEMDFSLRAIVGDQWDDVLDQMVEIPEGAEFTEDGFSITESVPLSVSNRALALSLIPAFAELLVSCFFYHYLAKASGAIKTACRSPFVPEGAKNLKSAGFALFFLAGAPTVCSALIGLFTLSGNTFEIESKVSLETVLWGFVLIALSYLFEYGATLTPAADFTPPPFDVPNQPNTPDSFTAPGKEDPAQEEKAEENKDSFPPEAY